MKTSKINFSALTHMGNLRFATAAGGILLALEEHSSVYPLPPVSTAMLRAEIKKLNDLNGLADGPSGSHNTRNERSSQRRVVYEMLVLNGHYVMGIANMQPTFESRIFIIQQAGYPAASGTRKPVEKKPVTGLTVRASTIPGIRKVTFKWKKGKASAFIIKGTQGNPASPDTVWHDLATLTGNRCELTLAPGIWKVRIVGIYNSGAALPSDAVTFGML